MIARRMHILALFLLITAVSALAGEGIYVRFNDWTEPRDNSVSSDAQWTARRNPVRVRFGKTNDIEHYPIDDPSAATLMNKRLYFEGKSLSGSGWLYASFFIDDFNTPLTRYYMHVGSPLIAGEENLVEERLTDTGMPAITPPPGYRCRSYYVPPRSGWGSQAQWWIDFYDDSKRNWMHRNRESIMFTPMHRLVLPGAHDAATYSIQSDAPMSEEGDLPSYLKEIYSQVTGGTGMSDEIKRRIDSAIREHVDEKFWPTAEMAERAIDADVDHYIDIMTNFYSRLMISNKLGGGQKATEVIAGWSRAQHYSIADQLHCGIRYFDLRLSQNERGGEIRICHTLLGAPLAEILAQVKTFLEEPGNEEEIVMLDINRLVGTLSAHKDPMGENFDAITLIRASLGPYLVPSALGVGVTPRELWNWKPTPGFQTTRPRVFVFYDHDTTVRKCEDIFSQSSISSPWPHAMALKAITDSFTQTTRVHQTETIPVVTVLQCQITPNQDLIMNSLIAESTKGLFVAISAVYSATGFTPPQSLLELSSGAAGYKEEIHDFLNKPANFSDLVRSGGVIMEDCISGWATEYAIRCNDAITSDNLYPPLTNDRLAVGYRLNDGDAPLMPKYHHLSALIDPSHIVGINSGILMAGWIHSGPRFGFGDLVDRDFTFDVIINHEVNIANMWTKDDSGVPYKRVPLGTIRCKVNLASPERSEAQWIERTAELPEITVRPRIVANGRTLTFEFDCMRSDAQ